MDGYNIIFAWDALKKLAAQDVAAAREALAGILANYRGWRRCEIILVFDAYKVKGNPGSMEKKNGIYIVYTKIQNALTSEPVMERLLPLDRAHLTPAPKGLGDPRGEVEMFPDAWTVFEQTAPIYMHGMIFGAMTESFCAEQSARMTAMDSATKSAKDMIHDLELEYNRSRQGSITQEITEIIGGAAAVQNQE